MKIVAASANSSRRDELSADEGCCRVGESEPRGDRVISMTSRSVSPVSRAGGPSHRCFWHRARIPHTYRHSADTDSSPRFAPLPPLFAIALSRFNRKHVSAVWSVFSGTCTRTCSSSVRHFRHHTSTSSLIWWVVRNARLPLAARERAPPLSC